MIIYITRKKIETAMFTVHGISIFEASISNYAITIYFQPSPIVQKFSSSKRME